MLVPVEAIPVAVAPIDKLEELLIGINLQAPLEPGTYGVHWGALQGYTSTDPRVYLFQVPAPPGEAEEAAEGGEEDAGGDATG